MNHPITIFSLEETFRAKTELICNNPLFHCEVCNQDYLESALKRIYEPDGDCVALSHVECPECETEL